MKKELVERIIVFVSSISASSVVVFNNVTDILVKFSNPSIIPLAYFGIGITTLVVVAYAIYNFRKFFKGGV